MSAAAGRAAKIYYGHPLLLWRRLQLSALRPQIVEMEAVSFYGLKDKQILKVKFLPTPSMGKAGK